MGKKSSGGFTIQFITHADISRLSSTARIKKLLEVVLSNKVVILQGRLPPEEETRLIEDTLVLVGKVKGFKGIELAVISPNSEDQDVFSKLRYGIANALVGNTDSLTIIGPASIVKEMKKDPRKLEVMMKGR